MDPGSLKNTRRRTRSGTRATATVTPIKPKSPEVLGHEEGEEDDDDEDFLVDTELVMDYEEEDESANTFTTTEQVLSVERVTTTVDPVKSSVTTTTQMERTTTFSSSSGAGGSKPHLPMLSPCPSVLAAAAAGGSSSPAVVASHSSSRTLDEDDDESGGRKSAEPKVFKKGDQLITSYVDDETGRIAVYEVGVRLEVRDFADDQLWYPARIAEVDTGENEILVHFENWSSRYDEWIKMDSNRLRPSPNTNLVRTQFEVGEKVEALWSIDGQRYPGVIQTILPNDYYQVLFDDGIKLKKKCNQIFKIKKAGRPFGSFTSLKSKGMRPPPALVPAPGVVLPDKPRPRPPNAGLSPARRSSRALSRSTSNNSPERYKDIPSPSNLTDQAETVLPSISPCESEQQQSYSAEPSTRKPGRAGRHPKQPVVHYSMFTPITTDLGKRRRTIQDYSTLVKSRRPKSSDPGSLTSTPAETGESLVPGPKRRRRRNAAATASSAEVTVTETEMAEPKVNSEIDSLGDDVVQQDPVVKKVDGTDISLNASKQTEEKGVSSLVQKSQVSDDGIEISKMDELGAAIVDTEDISIGDSGSSSRKRRRTVHNYSTLLNPKFDEDVAVAVKGRLSRRSTRMRPETSSVELSLNESMTKQPKVKADAPISSQIESGTTTTSVSPDKCADNIEMEVDNDHEDYGDGQDLLDKAEIESAKFESEKQTKELKKVDGSETPKKKFDDTDDTILKKPDDSLDVSVKSSPGRRGRKPHYQHSSTVEDSEKSVPSIDNKVYPETKKSIILGKKSLEFKRRPTQTEESVGQPREEIHLDEPKRRTSGRHRSESRRFSIGKWQQERRGRSESDVKTIDNRVQGPRRSSKEGRGSEGGEGGEVEKVESKREEQNFASDKDGGDTGTGRPRQGRQSERYRRWRNKAEGGSTTPDNLDDQRSSSSDEKLETVEKDSSEVKSGSQSKYITQTASKRLSISSASTKLGTALGKSSCNPSGPVGRPRLKNSDVSPLSPYVIVAPIESMLKFDGGSITEKPIRTSGETRYKIPPRDIITTRRKSRSGGMDLPSTLSSSSQRKPLQKAGESSKSLKIDKYLFPPQLESSVKVGDISDPEDELLDPDDYRPSMKVSIPIPRTPAPPPITIPIRKITPRPSRSLPIPKFHNPLLPSKREVGKVFSTEQEPSSSSSPLTTRKKRPSASRKWRNSRRGAALNRSKSYDKVVSPVREKYVRVRKPGEILNGLSVGRLVKLRRKLYENGVRKRIAGEPVFKDVSVDIIKCSCGLGGEHGLMVQCELCQCWQHGNCFGIEDVDNMPAYYVCAACRRPDLQKNSRRNDWIHEFDKTGTLPTFSFCESVDPNAVKVIRDGNELTDRLYSIRELIHSTQVKINMYEAVPDHPKIYQWHKPHPTPNEEVQVRNFNKTYRPVLRRLLRTHGKDLVNYKNKLREKVEKRIRLREEKRLGINDKTTVRLVTTTGEEDADVDVETTDDDVNANSVVSAVMSDILSKIDSASTETPGSTKDEENILPVESTSEIKNLQNLDTAAAVDDGLNSKEKGTVTKVTPEKSSDNLMDIDVEVDLSETDGKFTSMEQDLDAAFNLNPDRLLETIQNLTSNVSDDPETSDLLLNIFDDPDFADPLFPLPSSSQDSTKKTLTQETRNAGPAPEVRITPELCRENLKKSIQDEQKLVEEYLNEMEKKITELEIFHAKTRKSHSNDPNKIAKLHKTMQIILNNIQSMQGTQNGEEVEAPTNN